MKTIALTGPFNPDIKEIILHAAPSGFNVIEVPDESRFDELEQADYMLIRTLTITARHIERKMKNIKFIQKWGAGYEMIDVAAAAKAGIPVAISAGINAGPVSEMAVLHMLALYRNLLPLNRELLEGKWSKDIYSGSSYIIEGKTVGIVGLGNIGSRVAKKVQSFGANVVYYDTVRLSADEEKKRDVKFLSLEELLKTSDIISLHVPLNDSTRNMINKDSISLMKPTAVIINTARGGIIDEDQLIEALQSRRIRGAGLETFREEPLKADSPLLKLKNVVLTPHAGGNTYDNAVLQAKRCMDNIYKFDRGEPLPAGDMVNWHL